jgi:hypothetical protein
MKLIESKTLGTAQASIEFTSIPQTFTDLIVLFGIRSGAGVIDLKLEFNGVTTGYTQRRIYGTGAVAVSDTGNTTYGGISNEAGTTANTFSNTSIYIPNYAGSTNKSFSVDTVSENNAATAYQAIAAVLWSNTAAITSLKIEAFSVSNFAVGSTVSLYGVLKGSDGIVTTS